MTVNKIREFVMNTLLAIVLILVVLWLVGFFALPGVGALIHILLVIAVILVLVWLFTGKKLWK
jgi:L-lactate permease